MKSDIMWKAMDQITMDGVDNGLNGKTKVQVMRTKMEGAVGPPQQADI